MPATSTKKIMEVDRIIVSSIINRYIEKPRTIPANDYEADTPDDNHLRGAIARVATNEEVIDIIAPNMSNWERDVLACFLLTNNRRDVAATVIGMGIYGQYVLVGAYLMAMNDVWNSRTAVEEISLSVGKVVAELMTWRDMIPDGHPAGLAVSLLVNFIATTNITCTRRMTFDLSLMIDLASFTAPVSRHPLHEDIGMIVKRCERTPPMTMGCVASNLVEEFIIAYAPPISHHRDIIEYTAHFVHHDLMTIVDVYDRYCLIDNAEKREVINKNLHADGNCTCSPQDVTKRMRHLRDRGWSAEGIPLSKAVYTGNIPLVSLLIDMGANVTTDVYSLAIFYCDEDMYRYLVSRRVPRVYRDMVETEYVDVAKAMLAVGYRGMIAKSVIPHLIDDGIIKADGLIGVNMYRGIPRKYRRKDRGVLATVAYQYCVRSELEKVGVWEMKLVKDVEKVYYRRAIKRMAADVMIACHE